jgi:glycosyltransferase involved in cell wall biosynthesis
VSFVGVSSQPLAFLSALDVFVHPSWAESFPYVVLEAMSLGKPVVACEVGGIGEAIENERSGMLVAPRDPVALARALGALLEQPELAGKLGERAAARVGECFSTEAMIDRLCGVYDELVRCSQGKGSGERIPSEAVSARRSQTMPGTPGS